MLNGTLHKVKNNALCETMFIRLSHTINDQTSSPIFITFDTSALDEELSSKLDSRKNRCSNSHMRCEPKISVLEEYNFRLNSVASRYRPSLNLYTGPSITPTAEGI